MRDAIVTAFEIVGLLFIAAALGVLGGEVGGLAAGLGTTGLTLGAEAACLSLLERRPQTTGDDE